MAAGRLGVLFPKTGRAAVSVFCGVPTAGELACTVGTLTTATGAAICLPA